MRTIRRADSEEICIVDKEPLLVTCASNAFVGGLLIAAILMIRYEPGTFHTVLGVVLVSYSSVMLLANIAFDARMTIDPKRRRMTASSRTLLWTKTDSWRFDAFEKLYIEGREHHSFRSGTRICWTLHLGLKVPTEQRSRVRVGEAWQREPTRPRDNAGVRDALAAIQPHLRLPVEETFIPHPANSWD